MSTAILLGFFLSCNAQWVTSDTSVVAMKRSKYRFIRDRILECDIMEKQCDSSYSEASQCMVTKDSIILVQNHKLAFKDSIIAEKNNTIKSIASISEKQPKIVLPLIITSIAEFFLLILAIK